ncbi:MAG: hypothetical protein H7123_03665, partial [Thermoleophilia bacterium]|nr:hypothetical protein [Thermoleophilia bacterium]
MNETPTHTPETSRSAHADESSFLPRLDLPAQPFSGSHVADLLPTSPTIAVTETIASARAATGTSVEDLLATLDTTATYHDRPSFAAPAATPSPAAFASDATVAVPVAAIPTSAIATADPRTIAPPAFSSARVLAEAPAYHSAGLTTPADITRPAFGGLHEAIADRRTTDRGTGDRRSVTRSYASPWMVDPHGALDPRPT